MTRRLFILPLFALVVMFAVPAMGADFQKGLDAAKRGDFAAALREFRPLAEKGDELAQRALGHFYRKGRGVVQDYNKAANWYRKAAETGDMTSQIVPYSTVPDSFQNANSINGFRGLFGLNRPVAKVGS